MLAIESHELLLIAALIVFFVYVAVEAFARNLAGVLLGVGLALVTWALLVLFT